MGKFNHDAFAQADFPIHQHSLQLFLRLSDYPDFLLLSSFLHLPSGLTINHPYLKAFLHHAHKFFNCVNISL